MGAAQVEGASNFSLDRNERLLRIVDRNNGFDIQSTTKEQLVEVFCRSSNRV